MTFVTLSVSSDKIVTNMVYRFLIINHKTIYERGVMERNMILERRRFEAFLIIILRYSVICLDTGAKNLTFTV